MPTHFRAGDVTNMAAYGAPVPDQQVADRLIRCPECDLPAEVTDRFSLPSTDGPVPHVGLCCAAGHHLRMALDMLPSDSEQIARETPGVRTCGSC
ncbi:MAG: hypothetical protein ACLQFR_19350 [Streptosporangiaceae bacterium]